MQRIFFLLMLTLTGFIALSCSETAPQEEIADTHSDTEETRDIQTADTNGLPDKEEIKDSITDITGNDTNTADTTEITDNMVSDTATDTNTNDIPIEDAGTDVQDVAFSDNELTDISKDTGTDTGVTDTGGSGGIFISDSDPYSKGKLTVKKISITKGQNGATVDASVYVPQGYNEFAVVIFQHGFLVDNNFYSDMLEHLASHGFVVVAPQMYKADGIPIGKPKTPEEADTAIQFYNWLKTNLNTISGVTARMDIMGLSGHSRGGKVIWTIMLKDSSWTKAMAGVDPVDGTGGPLGGEMRIADKPFNLNVSSLIIGTGLGPEGSGLNPACAPEGDNHVQFYNASSSPAYHSVAVDYGHMDMLNDSTPNCGMVCTSCKAGPDRKNMRIYTAGQLTAFFRYTLQGDKSIADILTNPNKANIKVTMENK